MQKREIYSMEQETLKRGRRFCPRCGPGVFLAEHGNRLTCGRCKYTEFKKKKTEEPPREKPAKPEEAEKSAE